MPSPNYSLTSLTATNKIFSNPLELDKRKTLLNIRPIYIDLVITSVKLGYIACFIRKNAKSEYMH